MVIVDPGVELPIPVSGEEWVVGAVVLNQDGRAFAQRRKADRQLFPGCWDIIGGHVEPNETLLDALAREVAEETGWSLRRVLHTLQTFTWDASIGKQRHEVDFLVEVDGDLTRPQLEWSKIEEYDWFGQADLPRLMDNRDLDDTVIHDVVALALSASR